MFVCTPDAKDEFVKQVRAHVDEHGYVLVGVSAVPNYEIGTPDVLIAAASLPISSSECPVLARSDFDPLIGEVNAGWNSAVSFMLVFCNGGDDKQTLRRWEAVPFPAGTSLSWHTC